MAIECEMSGVQTRRSSRGLFSYDQDTQGLVLADAGGSIELEVACGPGEGKMLVIQVGSAHGLIRQKG